MSGIRFAESFTDGWRFFREMFLQGFIGCGWTKRRRSRDKSFDFIRVYKSVRFSNEREESESEWPAADLSLDSRLRFPPQKAHMTLDWLLRKDPDLRGLLSFSTWDTHILYWQARNSNIHTWTLKSMMDGVPTCMRIHAQWCTFTKALALSLYVSSFRHSHTNTHTLHSQKSSEG